VFEIIFDMHSILGAGCTLVLANWFLLVECSLPLFFFNISKQVCPCSIQDKVAFLVNISVYSSYTVRKE
jgi:hypothetical protein